MSGALHLVTAPFPDTEVTEATQDTLGSLLGHQEFVPAGICPSFEVEQAQGWFKPSPAPRRNKIPKGHTEGTATTPAFHGN